MEQRECFVDEEELNLYLDDEISAARKRYLKSHLLSCEECASQFDIAYKLKNSIKNACGDIVAPSRIRDNILSAISAEEQAREPFFWGSLKIFFSRRPMAPVGIAAMLVVVLVSALFFGGPMDDNMPFVHNLVLEHKEHLGETITPGIKTNDPKEVSVWVRSNTGLDFSFPTGGKAPVPGGACKLQYEGETIGYVYFNNEGRRISLFMLDDKYRNLFGQKKITFDDISVYCGNCTDMNYVFWKNNDLICVLIGDLPESSLLELARSFI